MAKPDHSKPSEKTKHLQAQVLRMRRDGMAFEAIAKEIGYSYPYTYKLYTKALKAIIQEPAEEVLKMELTRLDELQTEVLAVLRAFHPVVNSGIVVRDVVEDEQGQPVLNPWNGEPVTQRLADSGPKLAAVDRALKIMQQRARLLGLEKTGNPEKAGMTAEEFSAKVLGMVNKIDAQFQSEETEPEE